MIDVVANGVVVEIFVVDEVVDGIDGVNAVDLSIFLTNFLGKIIKIYQNISFYFEKT